MSYPTNTGLILQFMGYSPEQDYAWYPSEDNLAWFANSAKPTPEQVAQEELPYLRWSRKTAVRAEENEYINQQIEPYTREQLRDGPPVISAEVAEVMLNFIADCHEAVNAFDDDVDAATLETINTPAVDWPEYEGPAQ